MAFADPGAMMRAVDSLREVVLEHREEADRLRRLPDGIAKAFVEHDLYRALLPRSYGGLETDVVTYWRMVEAFSALDGSVGWNFAIGCGSSLIAGFLPREHAKEIFSSPESCVAGGLAPTGRAVRVDGGYRVGGRWSWASGIHQSTWVTCGAQLYEGDPPEPVTKGLPMRQFVVPRAQVRVLDAWHVGGMRGTGSTDYEMDETFVPAERSFFLFFTERFDDAPIFRMPPTFFGVALAAVALGIARGAIEAFVALATEKRPVLSANTLAERVSAQHDLARAESMVESSRDYLQDSVIEMWERVLRGDEIDLALRARVRRAQTHAAESAASAVALLYRAAGGSALYERCPLERAFRDVNAALGHITLQRGMTEDAGRVRLGLKPLSPLF